MTLGPSAVLLDTCAIIWLANGDRLAEEATRAIEYAGGADGVLVSAISAWEIGLLSRRTSGHGPRFLPDPKSWFAKFMAAPFIRIAPLTPDIAIDASHLPEPLHGDPADRLLIATARHLGVPIITRDKRISAYGAAGEVAVIVC